MRTYYKQLSAALALAFLPSLSNAQMTEIVGHYELGAQTMHAKPLQAYLSSHLQTHLTLNTPKGQKQFLVSLSSKAGSVDPEVCFYEGHNLEDSTEQLFIQLQAQDMMIDYRNEKDGKVYVMASNQAISATEFKKQIDQAFPVTPNVASKASVQQSRFFTPASSDYTWVDEAETDAFQVEWYKQNHHDSLPSVEMCSTETKPGQPSELHLVQKSTVFGNNVGFIGKRDVYIILYNYNNELSSYDMSRKVLDILYSFYPSNADGHFGNVRIMFLFDPIVITRKNVSWSDDIVIMLDSFAVYIKKKATFPKLRFNLRKGDAYHLLITKDRWDDGTGRANDKGICGMACYYTVANGRTTAVHEFGHQMGAIHGGTCRYGSWGGYWTWWDDVMSSGATCIRLRRHTLDENYNLMEAELNATTVLDEIAPLATEVLPAIKDMNYSEDLFVRTSDTRGIQKFLWDGTLDTNPMFDQQDITSGYGIPGETPYVAGGYRIAIYKVKLPAKAYYQFKIVSGDYDAYLYLLDKDGNLLANDDDCGDNRLSCISGSFNNDWYYVIVGGFQNLSGTAKLKIRYGWYQGGWKASQPGDLETPLDRGNGNIIYSADFGLNTKNKSNTPVNNTEVSETDVYPNPVTSNHFWVSSVSADEKVYTLYDLMGQKVLTRTVTAQKEEIQLPEALADGSYLLQVTNKVTGSVETKSIILKRK